MTWIVTLAVAILPLRLAAQPKHLPPGVRTQVGTPPAEMQCYDLGGFKELLKIDANLTSAERMGELLSQKVTDQDTIIQNQQQELALRQNSGLILQTENTRLFDLWKEENKRRLEVENRPAMSWVPWAVAAAAGVAALSLGAVLVIRR